VRVVEAGLTVGVALRLAARVELEVVGVRVVEAGLTVGVALRLAARVELEVVGVRVVAWKVPTVSLTEA